MGRSRALKGTPPHFFVAERGEAVRACRRCACDWSDPIHLEPPAQGVRPTGDPQPAFVSNGGPEPQVSTVTFGEGDVDFEQRVEGKITAQEYVRRIEERIRRRHEGDDDGAA